MYAVLDIETTGGKYNQEAITEVAIYRFDGVKVIDKFISLINPERPIQEFVSKLTGIDNKMLKNAPKFYEVAKRIVEITENCVLVAHNAEFDYRILRLEFVRLGFDYQKDTICTIELSRQLLPDIQSYSLGKMARSLGIPISNRHRADGDARATLELFKLLLQKDTTKSIVNQFVKSTSLEFFSLKLLRIIEGLPAECGVFYVYNSDGILVYIGWGKNIQKSVNQFFIPENKQKYLDRVVYELCGTSLIAQIKWREEVLRNNPLLNNEKIKEKFSFGIFQKINQKGYAVLYVDNLKKNKKDFLMLFHSIDEAKNVLHEMMEEFELCSKFCGFSQARNSCYNHQIDKCKGACIGKEVPEIYNGRVQKALENFGVGEKILILDKGRSNSEKSVIFVENNQLKGYGFVSLHHQLKNDKILKDRLNFVVFSEFNQYQLYKYLRNNRKVKIISL